MRRALKVAGVTGFLLVGLPASVGTQQQSTSQVVVADFAYRPAVQRVTPPEGGGVVEVRWVNTGPSEHSVTADGGAFNSRSLAQGATFSFRFESEGTFDDYCDFHASMKGQIVVTRTREDPGY